MEPDETQDHPAPSEGTETTPVSDATHAPTPDSSGIQPGLATLDFALLRGALEEIPFGVATTRGGRIRYANEALARILGAPHGKLEQKEIEGLFDAETWKRISASLDASRVFDGRVRTRWEGGREIDIRAARRVVQLGGAGGGRFPDHARHHARARGARAHRRSARRRALPLLRVADGRFEWVSPAIAKLTGLDASMCTTHPYVVLTKLVSDDERERLVFLYRRMAKSELPVASAQVSFCAARTGTIRVVQIRAPRAGGTRAATWCTSTGS